MEAAKPARAPGRSTRPLVVANWKMNKTLSEALAFDPQLLAKFSVALCELLVERLRDTARRV